MPTFDTYTDSVQGYFAPTVFLMAGQPIPRWNYYADIGSAALAWFYLNGMTSTQPSPVGEVDFTANGPAQTSGINVDFFYNKGDNTWQPLSYADFRNNLSSYANKTIYRFFTTDGEGPFYAIFDGRYFGISALTMDQVDPDSLAALNDYYEQLQYLKYTYNSLVGFLNTLSEQQLSPAQQSIYNEGILKLQALNSQIQTINGADFIYGNQAAIGQVLLIILIVLIIAAAAAWTVVEIEAEKEKTQRINDSFQLSEWVAQKKIDVANSSLSDSDKQAIYQSLDQAQATATNVANKAAQPSTSPLDSIATIVKWGVIGFLIFEGLKLFKQTRQPG